MRSHSAAGVNCWSPCHHHQPSKCKWNISTPHWRPKLQLQNAEKQQVLSGVHFSKLWTDAAALARTEVCTLKIQPLHQALQLVYTLSLLGLTWFIQRFESSRIPFDALCEMFLSLHFVEKCDYTFCTTSVLHCRQDQCYIVPPSALPSATLLFPLLQLTTTRLELLKNDVPKTGKCCTRNFWSQTFSEWKRWSKLQGILVQAVLNLLFQATLCKPKVLDIFSQVNDLDKSLASSRCQIKEMCTHCIYFSRSLYVSSLVMLALHFSEGGLFPGSRQASREGL